MDKPEPIKVSTLSEFELNPVDAYIEHLKETDDSRVDSTPKDSEALREGEEAHEESYGMMVYPMDEDEGKEILEKMKAGKVTAINYGEYQIQGAPDTVVVEDSTVRIDDMKTTGMDDRWYWEENILPSAAFQVRIYSWMISHFPDVNVEDPRIDVKKRKGGSLSDWFTHEVDYDYEETEEEIDYVLSMFEQPEELESLRPEEDWKNDYWDEFCQLGFSDDSQRGLGDF
jgi:hypothetical protein